VGKNWNTAMGAFGSTERRFVASQANFNSKDPPQGMPGPGSYAAEVKKRKTMKTVRGPVTGFAYNPSCQSASSAFRSTTCRSLQSDLNRSSKLNVPATGHYDEKRTLGYQSV